MVQVHVTRNVRQAETKILPPFLVIAFGLTWGLAALLFIAYDQITAIFGEVSMSNPLFILAVYAPLIASTSWLRGKPGFFFAWKRFQCPTGPHSSSRSPRRG